MNIKSIKSEIILAMAIFLIVVGLSTVAYADCSADGSVCDSDNYVPINIVPDESVPVVGEPTPDGPAPADESDSRTNPTPVDDGVPIPIGCTIVSVGIGAIVESCYGDVYSEVEGSAMAISESYPTPVADTGSVGTGSANTDSDTLVNSDDSVALDEAPRE